MRKIELSDEMATALFNELCDAFDKPHGIDLEKGIVSELELYIRCPHCKRKVQPIREDTKAQNFPMKCRRCRKFFELNI